MASLLLSTLTGLGWDGVHSLHNSYDGAVFWNCAGHRDVFLIAEQSLDRAKAFSASQPPVSRLEVHKELEGT